MSGLRIWHLLVLVAAAAVFFTAARLDQHEMSCTPISPILLVLYVCAIVGLYGARSRGRPGWTGFLFGLLLGPVGIVLACSNPIPQRGNGANPHDRKEIVTED